MFVNSDYLRSILEVFDGKEVTALRAVAHNSQFSLASLEALLSLIEGEEEKFQIGASWIILNAVSIHKFIGEGEKDRILDILSWNTHWQVSLHFLQLFPVLEITKDQSSDIFHVLLKLTDHKRPFVRAWACNALYTLAERNIELRKPVNELLRLSLINDGGSVRARIRNAINNSEWFQ